MRLGLFLTEGMVAFCALASEVIAARLVAPYAGMSTDTWTAIIAAFLLALALGNHIGGALAAGRHPTAMLRQAALATAAGGVAVIVPPLMMAGWDALVLAPAPTALWRVVLFAAVPCIPAGICFGIAAPLLMMRLLASGPEHGAAVGIMYGAGALGSVCGVLATLWLLLDSLGVQASLVVIGVIALANAALMLALTCAPRRAAVTA
jgi:predicted membrane-bound spermidine synthase